MARKIPLKKRTILVGEKELTIEWSDIVKAISQTPPGGQGLTVDPLRKAVRIIEAVDAAVAAGADHILLEEEMWTQLNAYARTFSFRFADAAFLEIVDDIAAAPSVKIIEAPAAPAQT
ncbi:MAG: hypothetical protein HY057_11260 [Rhodospirillales bacterium]|nr:hypothetical protein [Rhodospirillales bacterium]